MANHDHSLPPGLTTAYPTALTALGPGGGGPPSAGGFGCCLGGGGIQPVPRTPSPATSTQKIKIFFIASLFTYYRKKDAAPQTPEMEKIYR